MPCGCPSAPEVARRSPCHGLFGKEGRRTFDQLLNSAAIDCSGVEQADAPPSHCLGIGQFPQNHSRCRAGLRRRQSRQPQAQAPKARLASGPTCECGCISGPDAEGSPTAASQDEPPRRGAKQRHRRSSQQCTGQFAQSCQRPSSRWHRTATEERDASGDNPRKVRETTRPSPQGAPPSAEHLHVRHGLRAIKPE